MTFALVIGETEKNLLEFNFNQLLGSTVIKVNDKLVKKNTRPRQRRATGGRPDHHGRGAPT